MDGSVLPLKFHTNIGKGQHRLGAALISYLRGKVGSCDEINESYGVVCYDVTMEVWLI